MKTNITHNQNEIIKIINNIQNNYNFFYSIESIVHIDTK